MAEKPTSEWLMEMIRDEEKASKEYDKYGFYNLARDEHRHRQILERVLQQDGHRRFT
jgi:rubrerythrin